MASLSAAGVSAVQGVEALDDSEKKAAVKQLLVANPDLFPSGDKGRTSIWIVLVVGMFVLGIGALTATVVLALNDKDFSAVIALGTAVVGGVVGLFAKSPTS